jgi:hypothetical protein
MNWPLTSAATPLFDPRMDASQMTGELRRWFEKHGWPAAQA